MNILTGYDLEKRIVDLEDMLDMLDEEEVAELDALRCFRDEVSAYTDWDSVTLIEDSDFPKYVQEMLGDMGLVDHDAWFVVIDWESTAQNIQQDYTAFEFDGETYWAR